jgi:hypothetical protein
VFPAGALTPLLQLAQQDDPQLFLGEDFLPWMVLAFGAALVVGPLLALFRPPKDTTTGERPPLARTVVMVLIGAVAAVWGLASLLA